MSDVASYITEFELMCRREFTDDERRWMRDRLFSSNISQLAFIRALKDFENEDTDYLPAPKKVVSMAEKAQRDLEPKIVPREETIPTDRLQFEMARKLRAMILDGKATRQQIYDNMMKADGVRPGTGWDIQAMDLMKYYVRCKLPLDKPPSNYISCEV